MIGTCFASSSPVFWIDWIRPSRGFDSANARLRFSAIVFHSDSGMTAEIRRSAQTQTRRSNAET